MPQVSSGLSQHSSIRQDSHNTLFFRLHVPLALYTALLSVPGAKMELVQMLYAASTVLPLAILSLFSPESYAPLTPA